MILILIRIKNHLLILLNLMVMKTMKILYYDNEDLIYCIKKKKQQQEEDIKSTRIVKIDIE